MPATALQALRVEHNQLADSISKRRVQHVADAAEVLTPTQRSLLAQRMQKHGQRGLPGWR